MIKRIFPFLDWFSGYNLALFKADGIAGLTVALVLIPQSMAYAQLAGMPAYYGLYAAFLPPIVAALFGSSRQLATGPVAVVSLMTAASLEPLATAGSEGYIAFAILLSLLVGLFQLALGLLRLGLVVNFLSHPVVNGFTNAAAIIIATSQLSKMFGVNVDGADHHYETIIRVVQSAIHYTHWPTFFIGLLALAIMITLKRIAPRVPNVLVAVVVTTLLSWLIGFEHNAAVDGKVIQSSKAVELIAKFNEATNGIPPLAEERTKTSKRLEEAKKGHNAIARLDAEHDDRVIQSKIEELKTKAHLYREEIRLLLFKAAIQPDNSVLYYLANELPTDAKTDGRIWRVQVGSKAIKPDKVALSGGGEVIGVVPKGLPALSVPKIDLSVMLHLFPYAAIISLLGFMEAISIAKAIASKTGQRIDPNQELIGQGLANIVGAIAKSYPASGSFSRSAVNLQAGAVTGLSSVFTSLTVVIALMFFTPLLYHLPQSVLAAIIMMAVMGLINVSGFLHAWKAQWYDGLISILSFVCTLWFAPHLDKGIMLGVVLCLVVFLYKNMRPVVTSLTRDRSRVLVCAVTKGLEECKYLSIIRFEGPLFFANASYLEDKISDLMLCKTSLRHILIVANGINDIDASGEETLSLLVSRLRSAKIDISFSGVNETVMKVLVRTHLYNKIGADHIYPTMEAALQTIHPAAHTKEEMLVCPLGTHPQPEIIHP
ncbi:MAG: STAS domain-containing protein [Desulfobulbus sp.]|jgi:MFS superfamily sulfate permease-like transporter|uniref:SulP family inorganic anion transporter n=1 Tax=Desulfobulbus sp. TaxID=895 RepID=UPI00284C420E|nr:SulP family inorganic anion transporter [Desulfobulbus sp.]MDR2551150.1 STAS domain-containing protein [Desulfobulbus sp.]